MWVFLYPRIKSISYNLSRGQMFLIFVLLISIFQTSVTMYSLVNKESQHMFCNLFFAQETVSEWKEELLAGLEEMAREQVALLALDWKTGRGVTWPVVMLMERKRQSVWEGRGVTGQLPERCEGVRAGAGEGVSLLRRRAPG